MQNSEITRLIYYTIVSNRKFSLYPITTKCRNLGLITIVCLSLLRTYSRRGACIMDTTFERINKNPTYILWTSYFLYLLIIPALLGLMINIYESNRFKRSNTNNQQDVDKTLFEINLHHHWLMRTFIVVVLMTMASIGTMFYGYGYVLAFGTILWWFYRIFRGMLALTQHKTLPIEV